MKRVGDKGWVGDLKLSHVGSEDVFKTMSNLVLAAPHSHCGDGYASPEQCSKKPIEACLASPITRLSGSITDLLKLSHAGLPRGLDH
jgi:hypothetical protein